MVDPERLAEMRRYAAEIRADLERRELEDPVFDVPQLRSAPEMIFKTTENASAYAAAEPASQQLDSDDIADAIAEALLDASEDMQTEIRAVVTPLRERIAVLEGQVATLLTVLGGDPARAKALRKSLHNDTQLLEAPRHNS
jgi:hypothetical protein